MRGFKATKKPSSLSMVFCFSAVDLISEEMLFVKLVVITLAHTDVSLPKFPRTRARPYGVDCHYVLYRPSAFGAEVNLRFLFYLFGKGGKLARHNIFSFWFS
jgi:hypothetical protein